MKKTKNAIGIKVYIASAIILMIIIAIVNGIRLDSAMSSRKINFLDMSFES